MTNVATMHLEELKKELDEYKELSGNRLQEIEKLNEEKAQALTEIDKLKMDVSGEWFFISATVRTYQSHHVLDASPS